MRLLSITQSKIDQREKTRVQRLFQELAKKKTVTPAEIFDSEIVARWLKLRPLSMMDGFRKNDPVLPLNCVLFSKIMFQVCPACACASDPELLRPYLERELVIPVLVHDYKMYNPRFLDLITQYPYIGFHTFHFIRNAFYPSNMSRDRFLTKIHQIEANLEKLPIGIKRKQELKNTLHNVVLGHVWPSSNPQVFVLDQMIEAVKLGKWGAMENLFHEAVVLDRLRESSLFDTVPNVLQSDLSNILMLSQKLRLQLDPSLGQVVEQSGDIVRLLNLEYSTDLPVEKYLDIMLPRKRKIGSLVEKLLATTEDTRGPYVKRINDEIWRINTEIATSKGLETLSFMTGFVSDNFGIILGILVGALMGYASPTIGCGAGGIAGGTGVGIADRVLKKPLKVRKIPRKTIEWIENKIEGQQEKLMSTALAKDISTIQVYQLRKKLTRI